MASNDRRSVPLVKVTSDGKTSTGNPLHFMEVQADRGAIGLMLPITHTKEFISQATYSAEPYSNPGELYERIGIWMHKELHVPEFRARMRMIQLGNPAARGALNWADKKIEPFSFNHDAWRSSNRTFVIDSKKAEALKASNKDLRKLLNTQLYVHADGHIVRNLPEYVYWDKEREGYYLTEEAKAHVDKCCLRFTLKYVQKNIERYVYGRMYYDAEYVKQCEFYLGDIINEQQLSLPDAQYEFEKDFPGTFKDAFEVLMRKNNETQETMADKLGISSRSLRDWLKDPERRITADFVVLISQMWKLPDFISGLLLESAGISLNRKNSRNRALEHIRTVMWDQGIEEANKFLAENKMEPLRV